MKILHINLQYCYEGGVEQYLQIIWGELEVLGHENVIVHDISDERTIPTTPQRRAYSVPGIGYDRLGQNSQTWDDLQRVLDTEKPDLIEVHNTYNLRLIGWVSRWRAVRFVHDPNPFCFQGFKQLAHNRLCPHKMGYGCIWERCLSSRLPWPLPGRYAVKMLNLKQCDLQAHNRLRGIRVDSKYMQDTLIQNGILTKRITVLPSTVQTPTPSRVSMKTAGNREILFVGRLHQSKGVEQLLDALTLIRTEYSATIIGDGCLTQVLRQKVSALGLASRVRFIGWIPNAELSEYYRRAAVVVVPSMWPEPFGMVGPEAMSYARPVVAFKAGGISEWLGDGRTGFLVSMGDVKALAAKIEILLNDPQLGAKMGAEGHADWIKQFEKKKHIAQLLQFYQEALTD